MRCAILAFVGGAALLQTRAALPTLAVLLALAGLALAAAALATLLRHGWRTAATAIAGTLAGFCWAAFVAGRALAPALAQADEGRDVVVVGTVDSLPGAGEQSVRFHFAIEEVIAPRAMRVPPRVVLSWYAHDAPGKVRPGERWRLKVRLQRPHGNANPGGFDYELWLLEQGVRATGYVRKEGTTSASMCLSPRRITWSNAPAPCCAIGSGVPWRGGSMRASLSPWLSATSALSASPTGRYSTARASAT
ncbi:ComEC/Rec2 family competence protein [Pseudoduganella plicata]|uniref:ComEC/Rec2 family competence protein n=1 Tax=Pseudoduganella plicata TaxID=321984 RepID=UPI0027D9B979|nr:ComEC/Rec2 family competence protein [Pseudoduganella plicata]